MTTADDLFQAILAEPADDDLRLVYADRLDDRGGPGDAERAEFIRTQCELAKPLRVVHTCGRYGNGDCAECARLGALRRRERELLEAHGQRGWPGCDWCPEIWAEGFTPEAVEFRRGFPAQVCCALQDWLRHGPAIVRASPLEAVEVSDRKPNGGPAQAWWSCGNPEGELAREWWLPIPIYQLLPGGSVMANYPHNRQYPTPEAARLALSTAAIAWSWQPPCRECGGKGCRWRSRDYGEVRDGVPPYDPCRHCHGLGRDLSAPSERPQRVGKKKLASEST